MAEGLVTLRVVAAKAAPVPEKGAPRLYVETYGCQMNVADSDLIGGLLAKEGFARAERPDDADVILINTCAVREKPEERVFSRAAELRMHKRKRPGVVLGVTGCMAEHLKEKLLERAPYVDLIAGPDSYRRIAELVARAREAEGEGDPTIDVRLDKRETYEGLDGARGGDGVSGFITIQRGCDKFCTFCVVPLTRGRERGTPPREVLRQVRAFVDAGYKEVTLLGQTVNSYRYEEARFSDLLRAVAQTPGLERVRFTSPYPIDFTDDVIAAIASEPKVCKHVHLPLQSGSDAVLSRMRRGYTYADFIGVVRGLRAACPEIAITTDLIAGFCGETEEDHRATIAAMEELSFDGAFMFVYSEREGTAAEKRLPDDVPAEVKQRRLTEIIATQQRHTLASNRRYVGRRERVLLHGPSKKRDSELVGRTSTFKAVLVPRGDHRPGELLDVRIDRASLTTLFATPV